MIWNIKKKKKISWIFYIVLYLFVCLWVMLHTKLWYNWSMFFIWTISKFIWIYNELMETLKSSTHRWPWPFSRGALTLKNQKKLFGKCITNSFLEPCLLYRVCYTNMVTNRLGMLIRGCSINYDTHFSVCLDPLPPTWHTPLPSLYVCIKFSLITGHL